MPHWVWWFLMMMVLDDDDGGGGGGGGGGGHIKRAILFQFIHLFSGVWRRTSANGKVGDLTMMLGDWSHYSKLAPLQRQNKWYKYLFSLLIPSSLFNMKCGEFLGASWCILVYLPEKWICLWRRTKSRQPARFKRRFLRGTKEVQWETKWSIAGESCYCNTTTGLIDVKPLEIVYKLNAIIFLKSGKKVSMYQKL